MGEVLRRTRTNKKNEMARSKHKCRKIQKKIAEKLNKILRNRTEKVENLLAERIREKTNN